MAARPFIEWDAATWTVLKLAHVAATDIEAEKRTVYIKLTVLTRPPVARKYLR